MTWRELKEIVLAMEEKHLDKEVTVLTINHDHARNLRMIMFDRDIDAGVPAGSPVLYEERE